MSTRMQTQHDVLHATDTALRLVNQALGDLGTAHAPDRIGQLRGLLQAALESHVDQVNGQLAAVRSTTESSVDGTRDGLARAIAAMRHSERRLERLAELFDASAAARLLR